MAQTKKGDVRMFEEEAQKWVDRNYPYASFEVQEAAKDSFIKGVECALGITDKKSLNWQRLKLPEFKK